MIDYSKISNKWLEWVKSVVPEVCDRSPESLLMPDSFGEKDPNGISPYSTTDKSLANCDGNLNFLSPCKKILDIGSGVGRTVQYLKSLGRDALGVTLNEDEVRIAKEVLDVDLHYGDMHLLPDEWSQSFDGVLMWDSLEHSICPVGALREVHRILKPNGRLIIEMDDLVYVESVVHYYVPVQAQLKELLGICGFKIMRIRQWGKEEGGTYECVKVEDNWVEGSACGSHEAVKDRVSTNHRYLEHNHLREYNRKIKARHHTDYLDLSWSDIKDPLPSLEETEIEIIKTEKK